MTTRPAEGTRGDVASKHYSCERAQRRKAMRVIPQREPGGELYVRPGTCALLSDSLHNIMSKWAKSGGGTNNIGVPITNSGGRVPPVFTHMRRRLCGRNFKSFDAGKLREFVGGQNPIMQSPILPPVFPKFHQS